MNKILIKPPDILPIMSQKLLPILYCMLLRVLSECLILIGSAMFDATFNLVTRVRLS